MKTTILALSLLALFATTSAVQGQEQTPPPDNSFEGAAAAVRLELQESMAELDGLRTQMAEEKIPLNKRLSEVEAELSAVRAEYQKASRLLDTRTLDLANLGSDLKSFEDEQNYLTNLLGEYVRNFESRLHIAELQCYQERLEAAKLAPENSNLSQQEVYAAQTALLSSSLERLEEGLGGALFEGTAVDGDGIVQKGTFAMIGPAVLFRSANGEHVGTAEQRLGSLEPAIISFAAPEDAAAALELVASGHGSFPLDPTLGNAHKIEATKETFLAHVEKGGPVMYPIFVLAGLSILVALYKWVSLSILPKPSRRSIEALLDAVEDHDEAALQRLVANIRGPVGKMLATGVEHIREPRELIEEVMYESVLTTRLKLQSMLPFISISAASAPLLGLLGTVTGIIHTFKMITVYGSGDVKSLSGGISEALITTEFGLIVAIPSLLLHAYLSRKARGVTDQMEKAAVSFANQVSKTSIRPVAPRPQPFLNGQALDPNLVRAQVNEILGELLGPLLNEEHEEGPLAQEGAATPAS